VGILGVTLQTVERGDSGKNLTAMPPVCPRKLRKIEALLPGPARPVNGLPRMAALERVRARLASLGKTIVVRAPFPSSTGRFKSICTR
jgi:hypothetical protein